MAGEDEYEQKYMGEGGIVFQSKAKAPALFHSIVLLPVVLTTLILGIVSLATAAPAALMFAALPSLLITVPIWLLFSVLRATVTPTHLHIQYGLFGPKIPLASIEEVTSVKYDWKKYGGFGIRRGRDGSWAYNMMGDQGRAMRIRWRDEKGHEVVTLLSSPDPDALVAAVQKTKAAALPPKVRVAAAPPAEDVAAAERELDAELEAQREEAESAARRERP